MRVAVIPARGGSRRIPRKNIRPFHGKPIIAYSIETAKASGLFDTVYVSTEDDEIAYVAERHGAAVIYRAPHLARDAVGTQEVMAAALKSLHGAFTLGVACCIYPTCPMLTVEDLKRADRALNLPETAYAYAVAEEPFGAAGWFYTGPAHNFMNDVPLVAEHSRMIPIPPERCVDINIEADWLRAERMYAALHGLKTECCGHIHGPDAGGYCDGCPDVQSVMLNRRGNM